MKRIVIVGGMGPQAGVELHRRLIKRAAERGAHDGHEFPEVLHLSVPVRDFISDQSKLSAATALVSGALKRSQVWQG